MKTGRAVRMVESEIALVIRDNAEDIAEDVAGLTSILEYDLRPGRSHNILDVYYDTPDGFLRSKRITLRTRKLGKTLLLSLKSDPRRAIRKGTRRREMEIPWSHSSFQRLARELRVPIYSGREVKARSPAMAFAARGLFPVQKRLTRRETRNILRHGRRVASAIGELAIDDVKYYFRRRRIRLLELEIELKASGVLREIRRITDALEDLYPDSLREWVHSKFVTGLAVEKLLNENRLPRPLDSDLLSSDGLLAIDQEIRTDGRSRGSKPAQTMP